MNLPNLRRVKGLLKRLITNTLADFGYKIISKPGILVHQPDMEIKINLDFILYEYLSKINPEDFFFIQIGANDGLTNDPIRNFIEKYKLRGVLLEPQKKPFERLVANYIDQPQLIFRKMAIGKENGYQDLYKVKDADLDMQNLASFNQHTIISHKNIVPDIKDRIETEKVECISFDSLIRELNIRRIDLLQIDTEGYDFEIIKMIDFEKVKPRIIHYEHKHLGRKAREQCVKLLTRNRYKIAQELIDTIAYLDL